MTTFYKTSTIRPSSVLLTLASLGPVNLWKFEKFVSRKNY